MEDKIIQGDCLEKLKELEDNSVDAVVTDPPYGLSFMGKKWDYDVPSQEIWEECLRVLKPGGYLLSFAGTRTQHRMAVRIEDAGFEIRDIIAWVYGSGFPKSLNIGKAVDKLQGNERVDYLADISFPDSDCWGVPNSNKGSKSTIWQSDGFELGRGGKVVRSKGTSEWEGWGTALKPALEPITVARKPLSEKTVAKNCLKWGTGGINIDECRVGTEVLENSYCAKKEGYMSDENGASGGAFSKDGMNIATGRFPANLIHDGSDEVVSLFPNTKSQVRKVKNDEVLNKDNTVFETSGYKERLEGGFNDSGSASRFFYCAKASKSERNRGCEGLDKKEGIRTNAPRENEDVKTPTRTNNHPTVKPIALMEYLVKLVSREGSIVLDPFAGSGSTLLACKNLGRQYIGIEREEDYIKIINARLQ
jgi:DNA modification methylase